MNRLDRIEAHVTAIHDGDVLPEADQLAAEVAPLLPLLREWEEARGALVDQVGTEAKHERYAHACEALFAALRDSGGGR